MRFSCIEISFEDEHPEDRYTDILTANRSSIRDESDLRDKYYNWKYGDGFQWFNQDSLSGEDTNITVAFYESHPFFNCYMFFEATKEDGILPEELYLAECYPLEAAERFMIPIYNKWVESRGNNNIQDTES